MQDGQNLSDPATAFAGTWELDATLDRLAWRGIEAIYVGVHNTGEAGSPNTARFPIARHGGGDADAYLAFLVETLKPRIDRMFRTRRDRDATAILGSSMGGLVSLYAYFRYPSVFGRAGVMSPSIWFGQGAILDFIRQAPTPRGRAVPRRRDRRRRRHGARRPPSRTPARKERISPRRRPWRRARRPASAALRYVEDAGGRHNEAAWASRLEGALAFLLE